MGRAGEDVQSPVFRLAECTSDSEFTAIAINSFRLNAVGAYPAPVSNCAEANGVEQPAGASRHVAPGGSKGLPALLNRFVRRTDIIRPLAPETGGFLIERSGPQRGSQVFLFCAIDAVWQPRQKEGGGGFVVRADIATPSGGVERLLLSGDAIRRHFYGIEDEGQSNNLYTALGVSETATPGELRTAWRVRQLESGLGAVVPGEPPQLERAFNILAHPELRHCYDALRRREEAPPLFPYGGRGSILAEGKVSPDGEAFFAHRILAYKPEMTSRRASLLLRQCEFLIDRIVCKDRRRRLEVWFDSNLLPGIQWDLAWNQWKHWLKSRIEVDATFVRTSKYRRRHSEWVAATWQVALPSRLRAALPEEIDGDVKCAKAIYALLGQNAEVLARIRCEIEKQPVEHHQIQEWLDRVGAPLQLRPEYTVWRPDYEPYYFEQLRKNSITWFIFRGEFLFLWNHILISEVPQSGHATYVFARPADVDAFLKKYSQTTRQDLRDNRDNTADGLGFIGRVARGGEKRRWLENVLKFAGE